MTQEEKDPKREEDGSTSERFVDLNVKIPETTHRKSRIRAAALGITLEKLIVVALDAFEAKPELEQVADMLVTAGVLVRDEGGSR
jgi:hypothetical protein